MAGEEAGSQERDVALRGYSYCNIKEGRQGVIPDKAMTEPRVSVDLNRLIGQFPNYQVTMGAV